MQALAEHIFCVTYTTVPLFAVCLQSCSLSMHMVYYYYYHHYYHHYYFWIFSTSSTWTTYFGDRLYKNTSLVQPDPLLAFDIHPPSLLFCPKQIASDRSLLVTFRAMSSSRHPAPLPAPMMPTDDFSHPPTKKRPREESEVEKINLTISVDLSHIFPDGLREPRFGTMLTMERVDLLTIHTRAHLCIGDVDELKKAIQDLCWETFQVRIWRRNYKMWLQTAPYNSPGFPYGQFYAVNYDMTWQELLDTYQIPYTTRELHFRAHHSESTW